jgi:ATP synthase subunit 6
LFLAAVVYLFYKNFSSINRFCGLKILYGFRDNLSAKFINEDFFLSSIYFFYTIFFIVLYENLTSMIPETLTITAFMFLPALLSISFFGTSLLIAYESKKIKFFQGFVPSGIPVNIATMLYMIEAIPYFMRVFSLAIRLFINLLAGHILLKFVAISMLLLTCFIVELISIEILLDFLKIALVLLELLACLLQAVIMTSLIAIYFDHALNFFH